MKWIKENTWWKTAGIAALLGGVVFVLIYGVFIINPFYTEWLKQSGDLSQHYYGWRFFNNSEWLFPFGLMDTLAYPEGTSVVFTDSIPLLALFFKLLSPVLPEGFQYFGIWGLLCFMLQGALASLICRKFTDSTFAAVLGSLLFVLAPVMIERMYYHTALASQWLILLSLLCFVYYRKLSNSPIASFLVWGFIGLLCAGIHQYFLPMCGIICAGYCLLDILVNKRWYGFVPVIFFVAFAAGTDILLGVFSGSTSGGAGGLYDYTFNLNAFLNPYDYSKMLPELANISNTQKEGFAFLGFGVILLCITVIVLALYLRNADKNYRVAAALKRRWKECLAVGLMALASIILALSPAITFGSTVLFTVPLPEVIVEAWEIFRSTGRFIWVAVYIIMLGALILLYKGQERLAPKGKYLVPLVLVFCVGFQYYDMENILAYKGEIYDRVYEFENPLPENKWDSLVESNDIEHLIISPNIVGYEYLYPLAEIAVNNHWTMNDFYFARSVDGAGDTWKEALAQPEKDMLFVMTEKDYNEEGILVASDSVSFYTLGDLYIGLVDVSPIQDTSYMEKVVFKYELSIGEGVNLKEGEDSGNERILRKDGVSFGPYITLPAGVYHVEIAGEGFENARIDCVYQDEVAGETYITPLNVVHTSTSISYDISISKTIHEAEFRVFNTSETEELRIVSLDIVSV